MSKRDSNYFARATTWLALLAVVVIVAGLSLRLTHIVSFIEWAIFFMVTCAVSLSAFACARVTMSKCSREHQVH